VTICGDKRWYERTRRVNECPGRLSHVCSSPVVPKVWGAQEVCREKKIERNLHLAIFSELYLPYIYHPVVITNFITPSIFFN
jgi:hypothetical protein